VIVVVHRFVLGVRLLDLVLAPVLSREVKIAPPTGVGAGRGEGHTFSMSVASQTGQVGVVEPSKSSSNRLRHSRHSYS